MSFGCAAIALSYISKASANCFFLYKSLPFTFHSSASFVSGDRRSSGGSSFLGSSFFGAGRWGGADASLSAACSHPAGMLTPCMAMKSSSNRGSCCMNCISSCCCICSFCPPTCMIMFSFCISSLSFMYSAILGFFAAAEANALGSSLPNMPPPLPPARPDAPDPGTSYFASIAFFKPSLRTASSGASFKPALYVSAASSYFCKKNSARPLRV
mmetsp:Transcript_69095/g.192308  ORF Transcript_69095/g.192308 Transcript_69095/m.192308 type:complete len:213 (-) Transcript_69095:292-930(-)